LELLVDKFNIVLYLEKSPGDLRNRRIHADRFPTTHLMTVLYVAISYHGFGHIAQTAPVVNELTRRLPELWVLVECAAPERILRAHFHCEFEHIQKAADIGMVMTSSLDVRGEASYAAYLEFHRQWREKVANEAKRLRAIRPVLVLANIPYLLPAAAAQANIPSVVICSLNWAEIFYPYCKGMAHSDAIYQQIRDAYAQAEFFLNPTPSMIMPGLSNTRRIGPIARIVRNRRQEINERLDLDPSDKLVLLFLGGIHTRLAIDGWPSFRDINLLISGTDQVNRPGVFSIEATSIPHIDVLCSADALITKPGYGSLVEAACNGVPILYTPRGNWPEEPFLIRWLHDHAQCLELDRARLERGELGELLEALWQQPQRPRVAPTGTAEAAEVLERYLR
jgi:hypothetical protein